MEDTVHEIKGIGPVLAGHLASFQIRTPADLAACTPEGLRAVHGVGEVSAVRLVEAARNHLASHNVSRNGHDVADEADDLCPVSVVGRQAKSKKGKSKKGKSKKDKSKKGKSKKDKSKKDKSKKDKSKKGKSKKGKKA